MGKNSAHRTYHRKDGSIVPSTTTVLTILNKPFLVKWAWQMGRDGIDYAKMRDNAGDIGTLVHYLILCHLKHEAPNTSEYSQKDIATAQIALAKYHSWESQHKVEPLYIESPLVSERFGYGGTIDLLAKVDGAKILIDFKTSKGIWPDYAYQLASYSMLLKEAGVDVEDVRILRFGKDVNSDFEERRFGTSLELQWRVFLACLEIYNIKKQLQESVEK